jgi:hypothetical protein
MKYLKTIVNYLHEDGLYRPKHVGRTLQFVSYVGRNTARNMDKAKCAATFVFHLKKYAIVPN